MIISCISARAVHCMDRQVVDSMQVEALVSAPVFEAGTSWPPWVLGSLSMVGPYS